MPLLLDCVCRLEWEALRKVEVIMLGDRPHNRGKISITD